VPVVWEDRYNLILMPEGCDERTYVFTPPQIGQEFKLVLYALRATRNIDFLDCNVARSSVLWRTTLFTRRRHPERRIWGIGVPVIVVIIIQQVFGFVHCGEGTYIIGTAQYTTKTSV